MKKQIIKIIYDAIDELNNELDDEFKLVKSEKTALFGKSSSLDSLGLINLVVAVEQNIEDEFDVTITLADERAMSQEKSPFMNIGSLVEYIGILLNEKLDD